jgi:hypothetical protein
MMINPVTTSAAPASLHLRRFDKLCINRDWRLLERFDRGLGAPDCFGYLTGKGLRCPVCS